MECLRTRPGLFARLSVLEWRHRMLLRWLYNRVPAPPNSLALLEPSADSSVEQAIWNSGRGLPGGQPITALSEDPGQLAALLAALPPVKGAP
jgi:hypothetical protein